MSAAITVTSRIGCGAWPERPAAQQQERDR